MKGRPCKYCHVPTPVGHFEAKVVLLIGVMWTKNESAFNMEALLPIQGSVTLIATVLRSATAIKVKGQWTRLILAEEQQPNCFPERSRVSIAQNYSEIKGTRSMVKVENRPLPWSQIIEQCMLEWHLLAMQHSWTYQQVREDVDMFTSHSSCDPAGNHSVIWSGNYNSEYSDHILMWCL